MKDFKQKQSIDGWYQLKNEIIGSNSDCEQKANELLCAELFFVLGYEMTKDELNEFDKVYAKRVSQILKSIPAGLKPSKATNDDNEGPEWVVCGTGVTGD